jgi:hypothetical protein
LRRGGKLYHYRRFGFLATTASFMRNSRMSKTITIDDDVYKLLSSLKLNSGDSFTKVLRRHVHKPIDTAGDLLDAYEHEPPPKVNPAALHRLLNQRSRCSGGRK